MKVFSYSRKGCYKSLKTSIIIKDRLTDHLVQQQLVDIFCDGLTFDYVRMKILRENPRDLQLESTIQAQFKTKNSHKRIKYDKYCTE